MLQGALGGQQNGMQPAAPQPTPSPMSGIGGKLAELGPIIAMMDPLGRNNTMAAAMMQMQQGKEKEARDLANQNQTIQWLKTQGMGDQEASYLASDRDALGAWYKDWKTGNKPDWIITDMYDDQGRKIKAMVDKNTGKYNQIGGAESDSVRDQFGLNPIYGQRDGKTIVMQPSKAGGLVEAKIPEGVNLTPGVDKIDLGTAWGITNRAGDVVSTIPKDLAGAEAAKAGGKAQGEAAFDLPRVEQNAAQTLDILERMEKHPGREGSTGFIQGMLPSRTGEQVDFQSLVDQTQGQSFLQAFQMLKGGGQITEIEGKKATDAISRLGNQRLSDKDYLQAISDLKEVVANGLARARKQAGVSGPNQPASGGVDYKSKYGLD